MTNPNSVTYINERDGECPLCIKRYRKFISMQKHHITYFPQLVAYVHEDCHEAIHELNMKQYLQYRKGDGRKFYNPNSPIDRLRGPDRIPHDFGVLEREYDFIK